MGWLLALAFSAAGLSFDEALARVDASPELTGAARATQTRRHGVETVSRLTSNPQVTVQPGVRAEGGRAGPEGQLTLSQSFNLGGLGGARREVASAEAEQASLEHRALRRERRSAVARAWLSAWAAHGAIDAARDMAAQSRELAARLERAQASGGVTRVELATARAFAAEAEAQALEWEGRELEARSQLGALLGLTELPLIHGALPPLEAPRGASPPAPARLRARLLEAEAGVEIRRAAEVRALWAAQLYLSLQGGHEWPGQWFGTLGVGLTLPVFERGNREAVAHQANAQRLLGAQGQAELGATMEWATMEHELEHTARTFEVVHDAQLPAALEAAQLEAMRYAQGEATLLELVVLRRQALAARIAALSAEADRAAARAKARELLDSQEVPP